MKTQLEKFKEHCALWRYDLEVDENDFFVSATTQRAWNIWVASWQAAIESVVVELPRPSSEVDYGYELNDIQNLLTDAGIKYE